MARQPTNDRDAGDPARRDWEFSGTSRFELRRRLGAGGFGAVFEAFDRRRGATVALKVLKRVEPEALYQFKQEFRSLADVNHRNVVRLYELSGEGDRWFFTMEFVDGSDALAYARRGGAAAEADTMVAHVHDAASAGEAARAPLLPSEAPSGSRKPRGYDEARVRSVLRQVVEGVSALHDAGKLHRDVKASNALVTRDGRLVLVDFGLAVTLSGSAAMSLATLVGTPGYLAPEQAMGHPASPASDWYAVGVLLFELLTGQLPFGGSLSEILAGKVTDEPPAPSSLVEGVPPDLDRLCVALLARRPAARPAGAALRRATGATIAPSSGADDVPFVGRAAERGAIAELFRAVERDRIAGVALVGGPSGIGKSALALRACDDLRKAVPGVVVLRGRCYEQESVPYKALDGLIDPLSRYLRHLPPRGVERLLPAEVGALARLFPVLERVEAVAQAVRPIARDAQELRRQAFRALRELLTRLGERLPLVLFIDDLQWGDADSSALLVDLLAPPSPPRLLLLATYRDDEAATSPCLKLALPALASMRGPRLSVVSVALEALPDADARMLARVLLPESSNGEELAEAVVREAGGRPFFLRELAAFSARTRERPSAPELTDPSAVSLDTLVQARVAELPDGARRLLEVVAVAGRPVDRACAARAAELGDDEPGAHRALRGAGLVRGRDAEERDEIEAAHDRIREAVAGALTVERRADCARRLAAALDGTGCADAETLAAYFLAGGDRARAAELAVQAAEDAARALAFDRETRLYRLALDLWPIGAAGERDLRAALGEALVNAGRGAEAAEALTAAAVGAAPERAFDLRRRAAEQLLFSGHVKEGLAGFRWALAEVGGRYPDAPWKAVIGAAALVLWLALRGFGFRPRARADVSPIELRRIDTFAIASKTLGLVDMPRGAYFSLRMLTLALSVGEPHRALRALALFLAYGAAIGRERPPWLLRRAQAAAERTASALDDVHGSTLLRLATGIRAALSGDLDGGRALLDGAAATFVASCPGARWETNTAIEFTFVTLLWGGRWKELAARYPAALADARARGDRYFEQALLLRAGYVVALVDDDPGAAEAAHAAARDCWWPERFDTTRYLSMLTVANTLLYADRGEGPRALRHVESLWGELRGSILLSVEFVSFEANHLRFRAAMAAAAAAGTAAPDRSAALAIAERAALRLARIRHRLAAPLAELAAAGLAAARGDAENAIARLERAETGFVAAGCRHYATAAARRRGELGEGNSGEALIARADACFVAEGARDPARVTAMLAPGAWGRGVEIGGRR